MCSYFIHFADNAAEEAAAQTALTEARGRRSSIGRRDALLGTELVRHKECSDVHGSNSTDWMRHEVPLVVTRSARSGGRA